MSDAQLHGAWHDQCPPPAEWCRAVACQNAFRVQMGWAVTPIVWTLWGASSGDMVPTIVDACVRRVKALLPVGWVLIYGTLEDYETAFGINFAGDLASALREASTGYRRKVLARVKDEVQPQVLYEYGGVWLDASVVLMHPVDTFFSVLDSRLQGFHCSWAGVTEGEVRPPLETWAMAVPPRHPIMLGWLVEVRRLGAGGYRPIDCRRWYAALSADEAAAVDAALHRHGGNNQLTTYVALEIGAAGRGELVAPLRRGADAGMPASWLAIADGGIVGWQHPSRLERWLAAMRQETSDVIALKLFGEQRDMLRCG